jgi:cytidylate kinase
VAFDSSFDIKLDKEVGKYWENNTNFVFESRLAWHFIQDSIKIYIDCEVGERYRRIHEREGGDITDIAEKNTIREQGVLDRYNELYPDIAFPPKKEDFDLYIDATAIKPNEIIAMITEELKKHK